jgi:hypothetical protein
MTPETQTGAYQKIHRDDHAPVSGSLAPTGGRSERWIEANKTKPTNTASTQLPFQPFGGPE